jgi:hypothetical protein
VLIWWIVCFWMDEPGAAIANVADAQVPVREYLDEKETLESPES